MFDKVRGKLLSAGILALALSIYSLFFKPMWDDWLLTQGHSVGFGETATGYFITILLTYMVAHFLLRKVTE